jgi:hypothetical protein
MTPEEIARLQAGLDPRAYYPEIDLMRQARAGQIPAEAAAPRGATPIVPKQTSQDFLQSFLGRAKTAVAEAPAQVRQTATSLRQRYPQAGGYARTGLAIAGAVPALGESLSELQAGRPLGAVAALAPAGLSAAGSALIGRGPVGTLAGLGLMGLGAVLPGAAASGAESVRRDITGKPTTGKEGEFQEQLAMERQLSELGLDRFRTATGIETGAVKDLSKFYSDQAYLDLQRNLPIVNQMKNADLVRQQALLASQGNQLARLSVLGTAGQLAAGAQGESGATLRTMLTSNPYANAVLR